MTARHLILILLFPTLLYGQRDDCYARQLISNKVSCYLTPFKKIEDTIIAILPENFGYIQFDSTVNGQWKIYLSDSTTIYEVVTIYKGKENGKCLRFYNNGKIRDQLELKDGVLNGDCVSFNEIDKIVCKGYWKNNLLFKGKTMTYWKNGNIACLEIFKKGHLKKSKYWDKKGNKVDWEKFKKDFYECN
jgi:hypothetical protein